MKKCLAILFVCAFVGSVASAQWLVYDYKASIKRLDNQIKTVKYSADMYDQKANTETLMDTYAQVSDSLSGYLLVPICIGCAEIGSDTSLPFGDSFIYVNRKADKTKGWWKMDAVVAAGLQDKDVTWRKEGDALEFGPTSLKKLQHAWGSVVYAFEDIAPDAPHGKYGNWPYGFLGHGSAEGTITSTGFGDAKLLSETITGFCSPTTEESCLVVSNIVGTMVGIVLQKPVCEVPVIWDVCSLSGMFDAVISGTWSIKLNQKVTGKANASEDTDAFESWLKSKYGFSSFVGEDSAE